MNALIIVPCYNEEKRLPAEVFADFMKQHRELEFVFVNDGSSDGTGAVLKELCSAHPNAELLELPENKGKAEAVRQGMLHAAERDVRFIGFTDADLATPPEELTDMLFCTRESTLCVSGYRFLRLGGRIKRHPWRHFIGRIFATAASMYLDLPVYDTQCGAKFYASETIKKVFDQPFVTRWFFDVEILNRLLRIYGRDRIMEDCFEYPLHCWEDKSGSKIRFFAVLKDFIRLLCSGN